LAHQTGDALTKGKLAPAATVSASSFKIQGRYNFCYFNGYSDLISLISGSHVLFLLHPLQVMSSSNTPSLDLD
jgi:hypothetical protein